MLAQYGEHCMAKKSAYKCVDRFKSGRKTLDEEWSGQPATSQTDGHHAKLVGRGGGGGVVTGSEIALTVGFSYGSSFAVQ